MAPEVHVTVKVAVLGLGVEHLSSTRSVTVYVPGTSGITDATFPCGFVSLALLDAGPAIDHE